MSSGCGRFLTVADFVEAAEPRFELVKSELMVDCRPPVLLLLLLLTGALSSPSTRVVLADECAER